MKFPPQLSPRWLLAGVLPLAVPVPALADAVTDWNATANQVIGAAGGPPQQFRVFAMVHIAIHDALNAIDPRYKTYAAVGAGNPNASPDAAVARAARDVLLATLPTQATTVNTAYTNFIAALPALSSGAGGVHQPGRGDRRRGRGRHPRHARARRLADAARSVHARTGPGRLPADAADTAGTGTVPAVRWLGQCRTVRAGQPRQFNPGRAAMLNLRSKAYAKEYNEVKSVGNAIVRNAAPDSEESRIARFWPGGGGNLNGVARVIVADYDLDLWENARLFALMNMAINDGLIATFRVKYHYNFWRPYTAIRWANDGNAATQPDAELDVLHRHAAVSGLHLRPAQHRRRLRRGAARVLRDRRSAVHASRQADCRLR